MADLAAVVVTYNGLPYVERSLRSVAGLETVVVDHGSTDGTVALVRERFPEVRVVEQVNGGLAFGWNRGIRETTAPYVLVLNSDAWLVADAAARLARFADGIPKAGWVAPRLLNPDGSLQPSVRGFPTTWRLATEYLFLRKLAPRSRLLNALAPPSRDIGGKCDKRYGRQPTVFARGNLVARVARWSPQFSGPNCECMRPGPTSA